MSTPPLPELPEYPSPRLRDGLTILTGMLIGYVYAWRHGPTDARPWVLVQGGACFVLLILCPLLTASLAPVVFASSPAPPWLIALVALAVVLIVAATAGRFQVHRGPLRAYMDPTRRVFLSARAREADWHVENFFTTRPGARTAEPLWTGLIPALLDAADAAHVTITATALNDTLADYYIRRVPTFTRASTQPDLPRVHLVRPPQPLPRPDTIR